MLIAAIVQAVLAVGLVGLGVWGRGAAGRLPAASLGTDERARRAGILHRGATVCVLLGALFAVTTVVAAL
jgi:hypothetical protein